LLAAYTAAGETMHPPVQIAALYGAASVDKLKRDADDLRGGRHKAADYRNKLT
jgi:hypothetical protein